MGEYASFNGERIKIGTCEDMYYLRADQRHQVGALSGNVDPVRDAHMLRFRFPFPDEDSVAPGMFEQFERAITVPGMETVSAGVEHYPVQFVARAGYNVSLPCPESEAGRAFAATYRVHRNGFPGAVRFGQQRPTRDGRTLMLILECGGCGVAWRCETWADAEPVVVALRSEGDRRVEGSNERAWWHALADRITAGYAENELPRNADGLLAANGVVASG